MTPLYTNKKLIVNGCSFTNWWSAGKLAQRSWAYQQDDTFSKSSYTNLGKKASSNGEIILNTIEELKTSGYVGNAVRTGPSFDKNEKTITRKISTISRYKTSI